MTDDHDSSSEFESWEEVAYSNLLQGEALVSLLLKKGIISREEFVAELKEIHASLRNQQDD